MDNKEQLEREHSEKSNQEAVERIRQEAEKEEKVVFEDDAEIKLRDGKVYRIPPANLKQARQIMKLMRSVNIDMVLLNYVPTGDDSADEEREKAFTDLLMMAFINYPEITPEYAEEYVDLETARKIIDILLGINGLKKSQ